MMFTKLVFIYQHSLRDSQGVILRYRIALITVNNRKFTFFILFELLMFNLDKSKIYEFKNCLIGSMLVRLQNASLYHSHVHP